MKLVFFAKFLAVGTIILCMHNKSYGEVVLPTKKGFKRRRVITTHLVVNCDLAIDPESPHDELRLAVRFVGRYAICILDACTVNTLKSR